MQNQHTKSSQPVQQENSPSHILDFTVFFDAVVAIDTCAENKISALREAKGIFDEAKENIQSILDALRAAAYVKAAAND